MEVADVLDVFADGADDVALHLHVVDVVTQELQYRTIAKAVADLNFQGYFAHEFMPSKDPMTSLRQTIEICTV